MASTVSLERDPTLDDMSDDAPVDSATREIATIVPLCKYSAIRLYMPEVPAGQGVSEVVLGRGETLKPEYRFSNPKLSSSHCKVTVSAEGHVMLQDMSKNGTFVNGVLIPRDGDKRQRLFDSDTVSLLNPHKYTGMDNVEFLLRFRDSASHKRKRDDGDDTPSKKQKGDSGVAQSLTCSVCQELFHRPVACIPCLHNFCSPCMSEWIVANGTPLECMMCRVPVAELRKNHHLASSVDAFYDENPELRRSDGDVQALEARITVDPLKFAITQHSPGKEIDEDEFSHHDDEDDDDDDDDDGSDADASSSGGPVVPPPPPIPAASPMPACTCSSPDTTMSVSSHTFTVLPGRTFAGSRVELSIFQQWMGARGKSIPDLWEECRAKLYAKEWDYKQGLVAVEAPPSVPDDTTADTRLCLDCCARVFAGLLYHLRRTIPADQLTGSTGSRPECWYGLECRTQFNRLNHATRLSHVPEHEGLLRASRRPTQVGQPPSLPCPAVSSHDGPLPSRWHRPGQLLN